MKTFPVTIAYGAKGGPKYKTHVFLANSGHEQRDSVWEEARYHADVSTGIQTRADLATLLAFFRLVRGKAHPFRFKDWSDYQVVNETIGTGDGTETVFQIVMSYTIDVETITRKITHPVDGTLVLHVDGVATTAFSIDWDTGLITMDVAPPLTHDVKVVACEFDVKCRFDTDHMDTQLEAYELGTWDSIPIVELRV